MSITAMIMGESGTGKSTSIRNLPASETFIINVLDKILPFKGSRSMFKPITKENKNGNYFASDNHAAIIKMIKYVNDNMPHIKNVIIDDFQYVMANEFMRRAAEKGFNKFTEIAQNTWNIIIEASNCRNDLFVFFLTHSETDNQGVSKCKTIGKMLDEKICLEGMFTIVLHSLIVDKQYMFLTQNDGFHIAKSPLGMFDEPYINNDLKAVKHAIEAYYETDLTENADEQSNIAALPIE